MSLAEIQAAIPHRPPMLLLDEIVEREENRIVCRKTFTGDEWFLQGHYPGFPLVPGVILCEAAMQAGAVLLSQFAASGIPVATRMNDVRFRDMVRPGETVEIEAYLEERLANAFFMKAKVLREGKQVMRLEFACTTTGGDSGTFGTAGDDPGPLDPNR
jgi:3-hydroxyacyl-[acyl-carrier-protein] dehydratase